MGYQTIFKRYELKYMVSDEQKRQIITAMLPYMRLDQYGHSTIRNIYFDTNSYRLVRRSNEKPIYKEKLRIRSYRQTTAADTVFVELKKKYKSVVYKRRIALPEQEAMDWIVNGIPPHEHTQIAEEIEYFRRCYGELHPAVFLSYEREAFYALDGSNFRVTFDENILARTFDLSLCHETSGTKLVNDGALMEIKVSAGIPLWMTKILTDNGLYKTSFSKYGTAYKNLIFNKQGVLQNVE